MPQPFHRDGPIVQNVQGKIFAGLLDTLLGPPALQSINPRGSYRSFDELAPGADRRGMVIENPNAGHRVAVASAYLQGHPSSLYTNARRGVSLPLPVTPAQRPGG